MDTIRTMMLTPFLVALTLTACKDRGNAVQSDTSNGSAGTTATQAATYGGSTAADSLYFFLERTPCFGKCRAYRIEIYRSGYARYEGRLNMEKEGLHEAWIPKDTLALLLRDAQAMGYFQLEDEYNGPVTDLPSTVMRIVANGKDKRVLARVGTPPAFKAYVEQVEAILLPIAWRPLPVKN